MAGAFAGWRGDFQGFFLGLAADNSKRYFDTHRARYEDEVKGPMVALLSELETEFGVARLSRPNRDIRFSADKSPYKTRIYASVASGGYLALDAYGLIAAGGRYMMDGADLERFRDAVAAPASGEQLSAIAGRLRDQGYELGGQALKRVPAPHPRDHPRRQLLLHKQLIYWRRWEIEPWIATARARDRVVQVWRDGADLNRWFKTFVDQAPPTTARR